MKRLRLLVALLSSVAACDGRALVPGSAAPTANPAPTTSCMSDLGDPCAAYDARSCASGGAECTLVAGPVVGCSGTGPGPAGCASLEICGHVCPGLDQAACTARMDCHPLYTGEEPCDSIWCRSHFAACAAGSPSDCGCGLSEPPPCSMALPASCTTPRPSCLAGLTASYSLVDGCYEGCVPVDRCAGAQSPTITPSTTCPSGQSATIVWDFSTETTTYCIAAPCSQP